MSVLRAFSAALPFVVIAAACGPSPVGVDTCRSIEDARCDVASACGVTTSVDECKLFYRDQCLHGLTAKEAPPSNSLNNCIDAIRAAGACAKTDPKEPVSKCTGASSAIPGETLDNVCDVVLTPENTVACSFLKSVTVDAGPDTGTGSKTDAASDAAAGGGG